MADNLLELTKKVTEINDRLSTVEIRLDVMKNKVQQNESDIDRQSDQYGRISTSLNLLIQEKIEMNQRINELENRQKKTHL